MKFSILGENAGKLRLDTYDFFKNILEMSLTSSLSFSEELSVSMSSITLSLRAAALNQGDDGQEAELLSRSLSIWGGAVEAVCIDVYTAASVGSYDRIRDLIQR